MKIQVLGPGCSNCKKLFEMTKQAVKELNLKEEVEYITDVEKIIAMGVMSSPVLAIDGRPAIVGSLPKIEAIKEALTQGIANKNSYRQSLACKCGGKCS